MNKVKVATLHQEEDIQKLAWVCIVIW